MPHQPQVTLIVVPRERFSLTEASLANLYQKTDYPFDLVYIDGNSPPSVRQFLEAQAQAKGFHYHRTPHYLSPNRARNLGLSLIDLTKTDYVVFVDNDVLFQPGWLEALVSCAEETGAWLVGPLCLEGDDFKTLHIVSGSLASRGQRLVEQRPFMHRPLAEVTPNFLERHRTQLLELHTILIRAEALQALGGFDETLISMGEETDLCLKVARQGKAIYAEPKAVMTYVPPFDPQPMDLPFFFVRWSRAWCEQSQAHFQSVWGVAQDSPNIQHYGTFVINHRHLAFRKWMGSTWFHRFQRYRLRFLAWWMNRRATQLALQWQTAGPHVPMKSLRVTEPTPVTTGH
ncbi:MAG: glycosyltransferase [Gloeomargaritaceae cyanobacterium C42_A2020_066]|nr:glycosyltransferase [Gloeomargaritaceae cyanobacterium C42_A2020_066]